MVVGAGHNGLVAACYLARAGLDVVGLEAGDGPGGGSRTEETVPGFRFDTHSVAHNIINMTTIPAELDLAGAGLAYQEMDPFSVAIHADGRRVRFFRSIDATVDSIAESSPDEARAYATFMKRAVPVIRTVLPAVQGELAVRDVPLRLAAAARALGRHPVGTVRAAAGTYASLLRGSWRPTSPGARSPPSPPTRPWGPTSPEGPCSPGGRPPTTCSVSGTPRRRPGPHRRPRVPAGPARRGAALPRPGGPHRRRWRAGAAVVAEAGERVEARAVVTAIHPQVALLELLDPPLGGRTGAGLAAARRGNVVQALIHVATDRLPAYAGGRPGDWNGLRARRPASPTSVGVDHVGGGRATDFLPLYAFTTSAVDPTLAPAGHHTVYLRARLARRGCEGLADRRDEFVAHALGRGRGPCARVPVEHRRGARPYARRHGGRRGVGGRPPHAPRPGPRPVGPFRPTRRLADHRTPVVGLYTVSGAGTSPTGGIAGTPGRGAAPGLCSPTGRKF